MKSCAFTGHRPKRFPWRYDETARECVLLKKALTEQITVLADNGVTEFLSGMALGTDLWSAQIVLDLRKDNPALKLCCVLPCEDQEVKWSAHAQTQYHSILDDANDVVYVSRKYHRDCMLERNRYMVDVSSILLAVYDGTYRSGTGMTVRYAKSKQRKIILIDPITREVSSINDKPSLRKNL